VDLLEQVVVDKRPLLHRSRHVLPPTLGAAAPNDVAIGVLSLLTGPPFLLAPRRRRVPPAGSLALPATERMVDRVHGNPPDLRPLSSPAVPARLSDVGDLRRGVADLSACLPDIF